MCLSVSTSSDDSMRLEGTAKAEKQKHHRAREQDQIGPWKITHYRPPCKGKGVAKSHNHAEDKSRPNLPVYSLHEFIPITESQCGMAEFRLTHPCRKPNGYDANYQEHGRIRKCSKSRMVLTALSRTAQ